MQKSRQKERKICAGGEGKIWWEVLPRWPNCSVASVEIFRINRHYFAWQFLPSTPLAIPPPPAVKVTPELPHTLCTSPHISLLLRNNIHEKVESRSQAVRQKATSPWACIWMDFLSFFFVTWFNWRVLLAGGGGDRDGQGITLIEFPFMSIRPWHSLSSLFWEKKINYGIAIFQEDWWFSIYLFNKRWHN